jgi:CRISPR/Cas system-associated endoribonuclease Cas2
MEKLIQQLTALIDPKADDVRAYRLPKNGWRFSIGKSLLPEGVWIP